MATAAISPIVSILSTLIQNEVGLLWGVDKEMEKLSSTLSTILAVLDDAEMKQHQQKAIQNWLRKLKDAAYKVGDILDDCQAQAVKLEVEGQISGSLKKVWISAKTHVPSLNISFRHDIGNRMKDIIENLDSIAEERNKFHLNVGSIEKGFQHADGSRETVSYLLGSEVFGRKDDQERIVKVLTKEICHLEELSVYPIVGMGGIGKTTLAQMIFNDKRISSDFPLRIWVYVSQDFDLKRVMKQIIESISGRAPEASSLDSLTKKLREMMSKKRYLLVLDDAWSEDQEEWDKLKPALSCGLPGSCVVVTTRSEKVASITRTLPTHYLTYLSESDCWSLFKQRAFGPDSKERPELVEIGKEIVKKCGGVPLAAKALGGLLRFREERNEWLNIKESELWDLPQGECSILPALRLSYYELPLELRHCFSYCAVFPKGSQIEKDKLIQHWMANGLISSVGNLQLEDVGNRICKELYMRSFFQNQEKDWRDNICFKMHDLMNDLAHSVMEGECHTMEAESSTSVDKRSIRHVTLVHNWKHDGVFPKSLEGHDSLHTIMVQHRAPSFTNYKSVSEFSCDFKKFGSLRVFDADGARMRQLSEAIGNSKHLRYLNLSGTLIKELPTSICRLYNLQTLNLNRCSELVKLPEKMHHLRGLRQLCMVGCDKIKETPPELGKLTQLKTLSFFVVGDNDGQRLSELQQLDDLGGQLKIYQLEKVRNSREENANLAEKHNLRVITLSWNRNRDVTVSQSQLNTDKQVIEALKPHPNIEDLTVHQYEGIQFPDWMGNPYVLTNVVSVKLNVSYYCTELPALWQLPCLKRLVLQNVYRVEYLIQNGNLAEGATTIAAFPSLEELHLSGLSRLKRFSIEGEDKEGGENQFFPRLRNMSVEHCYEVTLPTLRTLETLEISHIKYDALTSISKLTSLTSLVLSYFPPSSRYPTGQSPILDDMFQNLVSLKKFWLRSCIATHCLPEVGIGALRSLLRMDITDCPNLMSLPDSIRNLTQLQSLDILYCSQELERRCKKDKGEDWHKIAHIPKFRIDKSVSP